MKTILFVSLLCALPALAADELVIRMKASADSLDVKRDAESQISVVTRAANVQCESVKEAVAAQAAEKDKATAKAHDEYLDALVELTSRLNEVRTDGAAIENCFYDYYLAHKAELDARIDRLPKAEKAALREDIAAYAASLKEVPKDQ